MSGRWQRKARRLIIDILPTFPLKPRNSEWIKQVTAAGLPVFGTVDRFEVVQTLDPTRAAQE
jgi:hypothetical protein